MDRAVAQRTSNVLPSNSSAWSHVECLEELFGDILSRLPVQCLLSSKFVSRHWHGLIRSPQFAELHFSRSAEDVLYIVYSCKDAVKTLHLIDGNGVITEVITLPHSENLSSLRMICSYNGLTCFTNYPWYIHSRRIQASEEDLKIYICNPATQETRALPIGSPSEVELGMGVAFGPGVSEYKVFRFFSSNFDDNEELNPECEIFSSSTGAWTGIGRVQQSPLGSHHIFCNGKVYWFMAGDKDCETVEDVLSVDMEGNFKTIELPDDTTDWSFLIDLDGCLSFVVVNCDDRLYMKVWIFKDENESVWELKCWDYTPFADDYELLNSVAARKNEIVFMTTIYCYILNTDKSTWKRIYFAEFVEREFFIVFPYKKSLLPCNRFYIHQEGMEIKQEA